MMNNQPLKDLTLKSMLPYVKRAMVSADNIADGAINFSFVDSDTFLDMQQDGFDVGNSSYQELLDMSIDRAFEEFKFKGGFGGVS